jgi:hypothetical protein
MPEETILEQTNLAAPPKKRRKPLLMVVKVTLSTFVIGNTVAWLSGAQPIDFPQAPYSKTEEQALAGLRANAADPESADALAMLYYTHNELDAAAQAIGPALAAQPVSPSAAALDQGIRLKQSGAMLDLAFGQIKLHRLRQALAELWRLAEANPAALDVQVLALAGFASVPGIDDNADRALKLIERNKSQLTEASLGHSAPDLIGPGQIAMARTFLYFAENDSARSAEWKQRAAAALAAFQALPQPPAWLDADFREAAGRLKELS